MRTLESRSCVSDCDPPILRPAQVDKGAHHDGHLVGLHGTMLPAPLGVPTRGTLPSCPPTLAQATEPSPLPPLSPPLHAGDAPPAQLDLRRLLEP